MKLNLKLLLILIATTFSSSSHGKTYNLNDNETVTLTVIGQGKTKDAAKYSALRNAIEEAFGTFISSNTTILNDDLIKDEIVAVSSGNIQNFEIISETLMQDGSYTSVVKTTVSIGKLIAYCESKGVSVEFKGNLFVTNLKIKAKEEQNRREALNNLGSMVIKMIDYDNIFDYSIEVSEPRKHYMCEVNNDYCNKWLVNIVVEAKINDNIENIRNLIFNTNKSLGINSDNSQYNPYVERASEKFSISNGITDVSFSDIFKLIVSEDAINCSNLPFDDMMKCNKRVDEYELEIGYRDNRRGTSADSPAMKSQTGVKNAFSNFYDPKKYKFRFTIIQLLTLEEISKITEYKVEPIKQSK